jgi:hypothetical protein
MMHFKTGHFKTARRSRSPPGGCSQDRFIKAAFFHASVYVMVRGTR